MLGTGVWAARVRCGSGRCEQLPGARTATPSTPVLHRAASSAVARSAGPAPAVVLVANRREDLGSRHGPAFIQRRASCAYPPLGFCCAPRGETAAWLTERKPRPSGAAGFRFDPIVSGGPAPGGPRRARSPALEGSDLFVCRRRAMPAWQGGAPWSSGAAPRIACAGRGRVRARHTAHGCVGSWLR
jgi:hypothetical protein